MRISGSRFGRLGVILTCALAIAACGGQPAQPAAAPGPTDHAAAGHGSPGQHGGAPGVLELWAVQTGPLGVVVTDGAGHLIYRSDKDSSQPPASACTDSCVTAWEPVVITQGPPVLLGVDESKVGTVARPDGGDQVTLAGWPLYRRAGEQPGLQTAGADGTDGVWFAVAPDGAKAAES